MLCELRTVIILVQVPQSGCKVQQNEHKSSNPVHVPPQWIIVVPAHVSAVVSECWSFRSLGQACCASGHLGTVL